MRYLIHALVLSVLLTSGTPAARGADRIAARGLQQVLPDVNLNGVALRDALDMLRDLSGLNMHVSWRAMELSNVGPDTVVNVKLKRVTVANALTLVLQDAGGDDTLAFYINDNIVEITTRDLADSRLITRVYPIGDLLHEVPDFTNAPGFDLSAASGQGGSSSGSGDSSSSGSSGGGLFGGSNSGQSGGASGDKVGTTRVERTAQLIDLITSTVRPDVWRQNGGRAAITVFRDNLVVTAPASVHAALSSRYGMVGTPLKSR